MTKSRVITTLLLITAAIGGFMACEDDITLPEVTAEYPIVEVARAYLPGDSTFSADSTRIEIGYEFTPLVDGKFASITGVMPASGTYQITLWDGFTQAAIGSYEVDFIRGLYQETFVEDKVELIASKTYMLTVNTIYWYELVPEDSLQVFPQTIGNVEVNRFGERVAFTPEYPNQFSERKLNGLIDFRFEPDQSE